MPQSVLAVHARMSGPEVEQNLVTTMGPQHLVAPLRLTSGNRRGAARTVSAQSARVPGIWCPVRPLKLGLSRLWGRPEPRARGWHLLVSDLDALLLAGGTRPAAGQRR
jgi:hypothetical protein